ncbi:MAG: PIN domain-containing protein [Methylococcales bacterium]|nr:PIN domain-containing protein [Methylococcales bacterium]
MQHILGKRVYFDVNVFIYAVEPSQDMQAYFATVTQLFEMAVAKQIIALTSELTLAEALVGAYKNNLPLVTLYEDMIIDRPELAVYSVDRKILTTAALLRSEQKTALADAIHVATALTHGADFFITQDKRLQTGEGLQKLSLDTLLK